METVLLILVINISFVTLSTFRTIMMLKGMKYPAALVASLEVVIYVIGLGIVLDNLQEIQNLIAYAVGFSLGILVGSKVEELLALGYVTVKVITNQNNQSLPEVIRKNGYGVTYWYGEGRYGRRLVMEILARRKDQKKLYNRILAFDRNAFIISYEPRHFRGGFWTKSLRLKRKQSDEGFDVIHEENLPGVDEDEIEEIRETEQVEQTHQESSDKKDDN